MRVDRLETWAGPGQVEALAEGQRAIRAELSQVRGTLLRHTTMLGQLTSDVEMLKTDVAGLKADVAVLKAGMAEVQGILREVLRRLPPAPG